MKIGRALGFLFDGMTLTGTPAGIVTVQNSMGNQDALDKFIAESDRRKQVKFPLIFYVIGATEELGNYSYSNTDLIIMMNTKEHLLYKDRNDKTYVNYINPVYENVKTLLKQNIFITDLSEKRERYSFVDVPNYGLNNQNTAPASKVQKESVASDYVDARIVKLKLQINTNCLIP